MQKLPHVPRLLWYGLGGLLVLAGGSEAIKRFTTPPSQPQTISTVAMCRSVTHLTTFVLRRNPTIAAQQRRFVFSSEVRTTNAAIVQQVARTVCELPARIPGQLYHCPPAGPNIIYSLEFFQQARRFPTITLPTWGCGNITGLGRRPRLASATIWVILGQAIGLFHPGHSAFVGE